MADRFLRLSGSYGSGMYYHQAKVNLEGIEITIGVQQIQPGFNAEGSDQAINRLSDRDPIRSQSVIVLCALDRYFSADHFQDQES